MNDQKTENKKINLERLERLTDEELQERVKSKEEKVQKKKQYYDSLHKTNLERLEAYKRHKDELAKVCSTILSQRKSKAAVKPIGSVIVEKKG